MKQPFGDSERFFTRNLICYLSLMKNLICLSLLQFFVLVSCKMTTTESDSDDRATIAAEIEKSITTELLNKWYPAVIDSAKGGYITTFTYDFKPTGEQDKMIVTQARHIWTASKAFMDYHDDMYRKVADHGVAFLKNVMWDKTNGGFYQLTDRNGNVKDVQKTAYGNAFAIYALAAYVMAFNDSSALNLAKKGFLWLEKYSHDPKALGYFQHLNADGSLSKRKPETPSTSDLGYKDQNSSIHLLEAFSELYQVWPDPLVKERLTEMISLIRDTIVNEKGNLVLFLQPDWTPVSFRDSSEASILKYKNLDHVSFGHDVETAYLLMEASHIAGITNDEKTKMIAKKMVDQALENGWDKNVGGFFDEGYYFKNTNGISIIKDTKNWWAQAEGLNTLLIMADLYPNDEHQYFDKFKLLWHYINTNLIDHEFGEWYQGGLDKEPDQKKNLKGHIWKASYHQYRSLSNCVKRLRNEKTETH
jgi:mannobiose 2-epimerase